MEDLLFRGGAKRVIQGGYAGFTMLEGYLESVIIHKGVSKV